MIVVDPIRKFEIQGQVYTLQASITELAVGSDKVILSAVAATVIRVMGWLVSSDAASETAFRMKNGAGGGFLMSTSYGPMKTLPPFHLPVIDSGYFQAASNTALCADVATATCLITVFYLRYKG